MFADTDKTTFIARREDGSIYGCWTVRQFEGQEEMLSDNPELKAFSNRPPPKAGISDGELAGLLITKGYLTTEDVTTAIAAKSIQELTKP